VYQPYDDGTQLARQIPRYPKSFTRTPMAPLVARPLTRTELTGPSGLAARLGVEELDLSRTAPEAPRALGQLISVTGRVTDEDGSPVSGAVIELWQANSAGKYVHGLDRFDAPLDPNFIGQGRIATDAEGQYRFVSIKPGAYPVLESDWWWRPPHIHFSIFGPSWMNRYVTQIFFPGEPLNEIDLLLNGVSDRDARDRLIFKPADAFIDARKALGYRLDFVLRGKRGTPALD
jgi:protocatechuate 3,4-dioxygenase beta subunit